jgi:hypothetical protein
MIPDHFSGESKYRRRRNVKRAKNRNACGVNAQFHLSLASLATEF